MWDGLAVQNSSSNIDYHREFEVSNYSAPPQLKLFEFARIFRRTEDLFFVFNFDVEEVKYSTFKITSLPRRTTYVRMLWVQIWMSIGNWKLFFSGHMRNNIFFNYTWNLVTVENLFNFLSKFSADNAQNMCRELEKFLNFLQIT